MTMPPILPDDTRTVKRYPARVLSPEEFHQARTLTPDALATTIPAAPKVAPPSITAPKDAVRQPAELAADAAANTGAKPLTGFARILTQYVAEPIMDHPLLTAAVVGAQGLPVVGPAIDYAFMGQMGKDVLEYSAQRAAELSFHQDVRQQLEQDPTRISGEQAGVSAAMLGAPGVLRWLKDKFGITKEAATAAAETPAAEPAASPAPTPTPTPPGETPPYLTGWDPATMGPKPSYDEYQAAQAQGAQPLLAAKAPNASGAAPPPTPGAPVPPTPPDPAHLETLAAVTKSHMDQVKDAWLSIFAPPARSDQALAAANILRATTGEGAAAYEQAAFKLDEFRRAVDPLPDADKLGFIDAIEGGKSQASPEFQAAADVIRKTLDDAREQIRALGTGKLDHFIENYFPHIWEDPERAADAFKQAGARAPFEGKKSFLKKREIPTTLEGIQMGLKPVTTNPVDLTMLKLREMQKYLTAHKALSEMKNAELVKFVSAGDLAPDGYSRINDKIATVFGKPTVTISEAFDAGQRQGIENAIEQLGIKHERKVSIGGKQGLAAGALGYARGDAEIASKFGTHDGVLMHELGHILDARYGLREQFKTAQLGSELADLADLRAEFAKGAVDPKFREYIQQPEEQVANALHAYLHAPDRMEQIAPNTKAFLDEFLSAHKELGVIKDIKPSLTLGTADAEHSVGGMVIRGEYWAPEPVAKVVNNHLSPGLRGNAIYDAYRGLGNMLNQAQLGLSAFHLGFTSMDATVSRAALGLEHLATGKILTGLGEIASSPAAPITNAMFGAKIRRAYLHPETAPPDLVALANAYARGGGRVKMDSFYKNSVPERMAEALKEGKYVKAGALSLPALFEWASRPIMEHIVPMQKLGVFGDLAMKGLEDLPPTATLAERDAMLSKIVDSVDNRMGQVVYDNLFWNRTAKDLAMASVRSVGWNLGTIRELGGGIKDLGALAKAGLKGEELELSHRAAYVLALPMVVGMYGAVYQLLRTGQPPQELKDYFYPRTGEVDADGNPERIQVPSYMKDLFAYAGHPWQTVKHKVSPAAAIVLEMLDNEDYYGDQIRNIDDPLVKQVAQEASYIGKQVLPFAIRNMMESSARSDASPVTKAQAFVGLTPAPREAVRSDAQNLMAHYLSERRMVGATPEDAEARQSRSEIIAALRDNAGGQKTDQIDQAVTDAIERHQLTPKAVTTLLKRAGLTPAQERYKRLTLEEAVNVFKEATPREKALFAQALVKKIQNAVAASRPAPAGLTVPTQVSGK